MSCFEGWLPKLAKILLLEMPKEFFHGGIVPAVAALRHGRRNAILTGEDIMSQSLNFISNADMRIGEIRQFCQLQDEGQSLMRAVMTQLNFSARAYHRTRSVKLSRMIADLVGSEDIQSSHLADALQYCPKIMMD